MTLADASIVLTDPGFRQEPRQIAVALGRRGLPYRLHTSLFYDAGTITNGLGVVMPRLVDRLAKRRSEPGIPGRSVRAWVFPDILNRGLHWAHASDARRYLTTHAVFDKVVARTIKGDVDLVLAMQGSALDTVRRAHLLGGKAVMISNAPDPLSERQLLNDEARRLGLPVEEPTQALRRLAARIRGEHAAADLVLANSRFTKEDLIKHGADPDRVVEAPLGVDRSLFAPAGESESDGVVRLLYVGSVQLRKGVVHLARAAAELRRGGLRVEVDAYGSVKPAYGALLREYVDAGWFRLRGSVPHYALGAVYRESDVFVFPTLSDGFGLVVSEAMASGVPVVVTDRCGAPVDDGRNGLVVEHANAEALARAIERIVVDRELAASLTAAGLETTRGGWDDYHELVVRSLEDLVGRAA